MNSRDKKYYQMSIVLLGDFQPAMFQPYWFKDNGIINESEFEAITSNSAGQMLLSNIITQFETGTTAFRIEQKRFQIIGKTEPFEKTIDSFRKIFESLSSITVTAYGINYYFHLKADSKKELEEIGKRLAPRSYWGSLFDDSVDSANSKSGLVSITMRKIESFGYLNLTIETSNRIDTGGIFMNFNFHHVKEDSNSFIVAEVMDEIENQDMQYKDVVSKLTEEIVNEVTKK